MLAEADAQVGGDDAWLNVDDTALPEKGRNSVGVAPQYAGALGKNADRQTLVSLTLARREVPVMVGLRLFLPESWTSDPARGTVSNFVHEVNLHHQMTNRSPKITPNWVFAS